MKVLHVVPELFGSDGVFGGAERYALELAKSMGRQVETRLLSFGKRTASWRQGQFSTHVLGRPIYVRGQRHNPVALGMLPHLFWADVIHCHQRHVLFASLSALVGSVLRKPVFATELGGGGWDLSAYLRNEHWFSGHLHISEYSRRLARHTDGVRSSVILGGVDCEKFSPSTGIEREPAVLFVGRLLPHKGVDVLVSALPDHVPAWLVGTEGDAQYLSVLQRLARGKNVQFLRGLDDASVIERYRRASVLVLPSVYESPYSSRTLVPELLGQTLLEAMACETPVICSDVGSMPEVVVDGECGYVVPPNDPPALRDRLEHILGKPDLVASLGKKGRLRARTTFSWDQVVRRCLASYREALQ